MKPIYWGTLVLLAGSMHGALAAQSIATEPAPEPGASTSDPDVAALVAEIDAFGAGDPSADPQADLARIADLRSRVEANGRVPAYDRGNLESAEGAAHFYLREYDKAVGFYTRAAELYTEGNAPLDEIAGLYNNQATILASTGRYAEAEAAHRKALAIRQEIEGERGYFVSSSLFGIGYVLYRSGRIEESIPYLRSSAEQQLEFAEPGDPLTVIRLTSLASVLGRAGRPGEALDAGRRAVAYAEEHLPDHPLYGTALNNLGIALVTNRLFTEAVAVLRRSLDQRLASVGEQSSDTAITLRNLAVALRATGGIEEAEALTRRAADIYAATGEVESPFALAQMRYDLADFAARRGDWPAYETLAQVALDGADAALDDDNVEQAQLHLYRAERRLEQGRIAEAREEAERWVPVLQDGLIASHEARLRAELLLARLRALDGASEGDFLPLADDALDRLEAKLADLSVSDATLAREAQGHREASIHYLGLAAHRNDGARAFRAMQLANFSELGRGQLFADARERGEGAAAQRDKVQAMARTIAELAARLDAAQADEAGEADTATLGRELDAARTALAAATEELRTRYPDFIARYRPRPVPLDRFQETLSSRDLLVAPVEGESEGWAVSVGRDRLEVTRLDTRLVDRSVAALRRAVDDADGSGVFPLDEAHALFAMLFPEGLGDTQRLLSYGGDALASLPLAMLTTAPFEGDLRDAPWVARKASTQVVGNLALFGETRERAEGRRFVGVGGSDLPNAAGVTTRRYAALFRGGAPDRSAIADLPPLPAAAGELAAMAKGFRASQRTLLIGRQAAEERFKAAPMRDVAVLAFATHGLVAGEIAGLWEPALLLGTAEGSGEDGLLGASEIARLDLDVDWVILSACNTASGGGADKPVYAGLASAFAQAGARSLLLSHWRVRDDAAAFLTVQTVERTKGASRAEALRQAQLRLIDDRNIATSAHPAVWAPFVLIEN